MAVVTDYLTELPDAERPLYGLTGIKTSFWSRIGGGAKPFVVLLMADRVILSKRSVGGIKQLWGEEHALTDLVDLSTRNGPFLDSALFTFANGFKIRIGNIPHTQIAPVAGFMKEGAAAFEWSHLTDVQRTNCYYTFTMMKILPRDLL
jgi:hypothetical protein